MDSLVEFVVDEIAMDGPQGSTIESVYRLIRSGLSLTEPDSRLEKFVVELLIQNDKLHIGHLNPSTNQLEPDHSINLTGLDPLEHDSVFVWADEAHSWEAITGSHARPSSVTPAVFAILCSVSRSRASGKSVVALGKELGIDQRSMFHYVKAAQNIGAIKKFRTTDQGSWTNHLVHVRYLDQSTKWQAHIAHDPSASAFASNIHDDDDGNGDSDGEFDSTEASSSFGILLNSSHLHSNGGLIRSRILAALAQAEQHTLAHSQVANKIGLLYFTTRDQRKFNSILREMIDQGLLERVVIQAHSSAQRSSGLRLADHAHPSAQSSAEQAAQDEAQAEDDLSHAQLMVPIERQVIDLLSSADGDGLTNRHIGHALGGYGPRAVDQTLVRLGREQDPIGLSDLSVRSMTETIGREKRTRWFTTTGYNRRCQRDGLAHQPPTESTTGQWPDPTINFVQFEKPDELDSLLGGYNVKSQLPSASAWNKNQPRRSAPSAKPQPISNKPIGRPRKHPLKPGQLTYYERRKRQLAQQAASDPSATQLDPELEPQRKTPKPRSKAPTRLKAQPSTPTSTLDSTPQPLAQLAPPPDQPSTITTAPAADPASAPEPSLAEPESRTTAEPKMTLTLLTRQRDVADFITSQGGIIENLYRLNEKLRAFQAQTRPSESLHTMDRQVLNQVIHSLVKSEQCRLTVVSTEDVARVEVISLSSIDPAGPAMTDWLATLHTRPRPLRGYQRPRPDRALVVAQSDPIRPASLVPSATDSLDIVANFFRQSDKVLGYWRGCLYGRFARARVLHRHLVNLAWNGAESSSPQDGIVLHAEVIQKMAIEEWLSIILVSEDEPSLDQFLHDHSHRRWRLEQIPAHLAHFVRNRRRRQALIQLIDSLAQLGIISPASPSTKLSQSQAWRLNSLGPVYSFNQQPHRLVKVMPIQTRAQVDAYWDQLQAYSLPGPVQSDPLGHEGEGGPFPPLYSAKPSLLSAITSISKWRAHYFLTSDQRKYLTRLAKHDQSKLEDPEFVATIASAVFAPAETIEAYLTRQRAEPGQAKAGRKPHKRTRRAAAQSAFEVGVETEAAPVGTEQGAISLRRKAKDATAQRQRDFTAILERFKHDHANPTLNQKAITFLEKAFTLPSRTSKTGLLDSHHLERELLGLLPNAAPPDSNSIIPKSILNALSDSYSLPKVFTLVPRAPRKDKGVRRPPAKVISSGSQLDFLSAAPRSLPPRTPGTRLRLSRHYFSQEQEDLLLDAGAIVKARARLNGQRAQFGPLESLFPQIGASKLRQTLLRLIAKPEHQLYHSRLEQAWLEACQTSAVCALVGPSRGASLTQFDLAAHVRALRSNVNKHALRLAGPPPEHQPDLIKLAHSTEDILNDYSVNFVAGPVWGSSAYWRPSPSTATREHDAANLSFSLAKLQLGQAQSISNSNLDQLTRRRALGALKMILVTDELAYDQTAAHALLRPFVDQLESIVQELLHANLIAKVVADPTRRTPGRNFVLTDKFAALFDSHVQADKLTLALGPNQPPAPPTWPIVSEPGAVLSLIDQISCRSVGVRVEAGMSTLARDSEDYQTRKADDEVIESRLTIQSAPAQPDRNQPGLSTEQPAIWPGSLPSEHQAQTRLRAQRSTEAAELLGALEQAGPAGLELDQAELVGTADQMDSIEQTGLAFWAGITEPVLVGSQFIQWWAVELGPGVSAEERVWVMPAVWIGLDRVIVDSIWQKAQGLILATLLSWPGSDWRQVYCRASPGGSDSVLSLSEVIVVLRTLERGGLVRRATEPVSLGRVSWYLSST